MTILGLETSTAVCSVGLFREGKPDLEQSLQESHIHSEKLLTLVQRVVREGELTFDQMDAIAVSIGPGSFTGLRIGLSTAKGLSYATGKPLVAVSTFEAIAEAARRQYPSTPLITVLIDAKKNEWYVGQFRVVNGRIEALTPVEVMPFEKATAAVKAGGLPLVVTDKVVEVRQFVGDSITVEGVYPYCRGSVVASLASGKINRREFSDAPTLEPMYLKDFVVRRVAPIS